MLALFLTTQQHASTAYVLAANETGWLTGWQCKLMEMLSALNYRLVVHRCRGSTGAVVLLLLLLQQSG